VEPPPKVKVGDRDVNLDSLDAQGYADLLEQVRDQPETLERIEYALASSVQQGRGKAKIASLPPPEDSKVVYPSRLLGRLEKLALVGAVKGRLRPRACMELGLFEYYQEKEARNGNADEDVVACPFGEAYAALGLSGNPQAGYSAAVFFFTKAITGLERNELWREMDARRAAASVGIALVLWDWGDRAGALELFEEARAILLSRHNADVGKVRQYIEALLAEGPPPDGQVSAVAAAVKEKLGLTQRMR